MSSLENSNENDSRPRYLVTGQSSAPGSAPSDIRLRTPIRDVPAIELGAARLLEKLGIRRAVDLLFHFPRSFEEATPIKSVEDFVENERVSFLGTVSELDERTTQNGRHMLGAQVLPDLPSVDFSKPDDSRVVLPTNRPARSRAGVRLLWFNQGFRKRMLAPGIRVRATGVLKSTVLNWEMVQPQIEVLEDGEIPEDLRPLPVYPLTEGIKQFQMRKIIRESIAPLVALVEEVLPEEVRRILSVSDIQTALKAIHLPEDMESALAAMRRFKTQELLVLQLAISMQRASRESGVKAPRCEPTGRIHSRILKRIGLPLTQDQLNAVADVGQDMNRDTAMNRLLQGDVGSGKTVVAQYAMMLTVAHGFQAALMAPTEVLAQQHANTLEKSLASSRVRIALLTGSLTKSQRRDVLERIAAGEVDLVVGTQALLSSDLQFKNLGLVIVDEQHKFGVRQRAQLRVDDAQPHYLVLSATPIPRTIAMTAFGDLDVSTIRQKPPGRAEVHTYVASPSELESWWKFVDGKIDEGRQAFVIAPRVSESNDETSSGEVASAEGAFAELCANQFQHRTVGLLHGRMDSRAKEQVLGEFAEGRIDVLVSTTVVEVGIDVANATVMAILDANRLGLSQLHQLRGRVSRGTHPGYVCALASAGCDSNDNERLNAFKSSNDGFELAEMDLRIRGPGDLLGTSQSGLPPLKIASLVDDAELLVLARTVAREILADDPLLSAPEYERLRRQTLNRYGVWMELSDVG